MATRKSKPRAKKALQIEETPLFENLAFTPLSLDNVIGESLPEDAQDFCAGTETAPPAADTEPAAEPAQDLPAVPKTAADTESAAEPPVAEKPRRANIIDTEDIELTCDSAEGMPPLIPMDADELPFEQQSFVHIDLEELVEAAGFVVGKSTVTGAQEKTAAPHQDTSAGEDYARKYTPPAAERQCANAAAEPLCLCNKTVRTRRSGSFRPARTVCRNFRQRQRFGFDRNYFVLGRLGRERLSFHAGTEHPE